MSRKNRTEPLVADVKWIQAEGASHGGWAATVTTDDGVRYSATARSPTKAFSRLEIEVGQSEGDALKLEPKYHVPRPLYQRYSKLNKQLLQFMELRKEILPERAAIAHELVRSYDMPLGVVSKLIGLSPARIGVLLDRIASGENVIGKLGRPKRSDDDDDDL